MACQHVVDTQIALQHAVEAVQHLEFDLRPPSVVRSSTIARSLFLTRRVCKYTHTLRLARRAVSALTGQVCTRQQDTAADRSQRPLPACNTRACALGKQGHARAVEEQS